MAAGKPEKAPKKEEGQEITRYRRNFLLVKDE
jgi:hypothetical protein